ncbi:MAG: glycosyltransferase family 2 protein [Candidatus Riflebacteria bacterium HGW-Riflebacteria-2]|jgi:GT2 family glycosyltransferase|nr:MAG: glycosyltransferase family 2 protein [Candidatus Riflebacteria bacterium HGW-Riflebacteria-2]
MPVASIIILNWNGKHHLPDCLASLEQQTYRDFECVLVDNGSSDGSGDYIRQFYPWVKLVCLDKNSGFAAGNVIALSYCLGSYIITLNNDTILEPQWLEEIVKVADDNPLAGMIASRICSAKDHDIIDSLGIKICLDGMSRGAFRNQKYSALREIPSEILCPSACAGLYRREMINQVGFFDESFFAYCEDTDLGLRCRRAGWKALLAEKAVVYHKYSASFGAFSPFKLYLVERNHFWTLFKNFPAILVILFPVLTAFRYLLQFLLLLKNDGVGRNFRENSSQWSCLFAFAKGLLHGLIGIYTIFSVKSASNFWPDKVDFEFMKLLLAHKLSFKELLGE